MITSNPITTQNKLSRALQHQEDLKIQKDFKMKKEQKEQEKEKVNKLTLPNHTTFMEAGVETQGEGFLNIGFSPVQLKVVVYILKQLQPYVIPQLELITQAVNSKNDTPNLLKVIQTELFQGIGGVYYCDLPKRVFVKGANYKYFANQVDSLAAMRIKFRRRNPLTKRMAMYTTNLFSVYEDINSEKAKNRHITVEMTQNVVEHLCSISVAKKGEIVWNADYYNNLIYDVILRCNKRYSGLLYFYLCTWRRRKGWRVKTFDLRNMLGIAEKLYKKPSDFKKYVLIPSSLELKGIGLDFWFEADFDGEFINFKLITPESIASAVENQNRAIAFLKSAHVSEVDINKLRPIISEIKVDEKFQKVIGDCLDEYMKRKRTDNPINNLSKYILSAIQNWHRNRKGLKKKYV